MSPTLSILQKNVRQVILQNLCEMIQKAKAKNMADKVPYGYYGRLVSDISYEQPWVTVNILKKAFKKFEEQQSNEESVVPESVAGVESSTSDLSDLTESAGGMSQSTSISWESGDASQRSKGGRKKGQTNALKEHTKNAVIALQNEIVSVYLDEKQKCGKKRMKNRRLREIAEELQQKYNLEDYEPNFRTLEKRIQFRKNSVHHRGHVTPMAKVEPLLVSLILQLSRIRAPITCANGLNLANSVI